MLKRHRKLARQRAWRYAQEEKHRCQWFALCDRPATTTAPHPTLGDVPSCARCAAFAKS